MCSHIVITTLYLCGNISCSKLQPTTPSCWGDIPCFFPGLYMVFNKYMGLEPVHSIFKKLHQEPDWLTWSSTATSVPRVLSVFHFCVKDRPSSFILYLVSRLPPALPVSMLVEPDVLNSWKVSKKDVSMLNSNMDSGGDGTWNKLYEGAKVMMKTKITCRINTKTRREITWLIYGNVRRIPIACNCGPLE